MRQDLIKKINAFPEIRLDQIIPLIFLYEAGVITKMDLEKGIEIFFRKVEEGGRVKDDLIKILK